MNWAITIAQLILQYGPEAARKIVELIRDVKGPGDVTPDMWDKLTALATKPYDAYVK